MRLINKKAAAMRAAKYFGNANYVLGTRDPRRRADDWTTESQFCAARRKKSAPDAHTQTAYFGDAARPP
jgi:hypothetical protein